MDLERVHTFSSQKPGKPALAHYHTHLPSTVHGLLSPLKLHEMITLKAQSNNVWYHTKTITLIPQAINLHKSTVRREVEEGPEIYSRVLMLLALQTGKAAHLAQP